MSVNSRGMRPIFIGGCPRSGTTLLGALLGAHSRVICVPEMPFKVTLKSDLEWDSAGISRQDVREFLGRQGKFRLWGIPPIPAASDPGMEGSENIAYSDAIEELIRAYAAETRKPESDVWVDHTPYNVRHARKLLDWFPDARLIHIVRDGRGVAASLLQVDFGPNSIQDAARLWPEWLGYGLAAEMQQPSRVMRVHYETLLRDPISTLAQLCTWLDLSMESRMGTATEFRIPSFTMRDHALVAGPPDPRRAEAWKHTLTRRQIEIFESAAGDLLEFMGYSLEFDGQARRPNTREKLSDRWRDVVLGSANYFRNRFRLRASARQQRPGRRSPGGPPEA